MSALKLAAVLVLGALVAATVAAVVFVSAAIIAATVRGIQHW